MTETEPKETPFIMTARSGRVRGDDYVAFWIIEQRGWIGEYCASNGIGIHAGNFPQWDDPVLYARGIREDQDTVPMLIKMDRYALLTEAIAAFNAHHAKLAKSRAEPEKAKGEGSLCIVCGEINPDTTRVYECCDRCWENVGDGALARAQAAKETSHPRRILGGFDLGGAGGTLCGDHPGYAVDNCCSYISSATGVCMFWGAREMNNGDWYLRLDQCLAAEKAYKALRGLFEVTDDGD